jgi:hypothetical protein
MDENSSQEEALGLVPITGEPRVNLEQVFNNAKSQWRDLPQPAVLKKDSLQRRTKTAARAQSQPVPATEVREPLRSLLTNVPAQQGEIFSSPRSLAHPLSLREDLMYDAVDE